MSEIAIINGLAATKHRQALCRAVNVRARVVRYHSTGEAWDNTAAVKVTARLAELFLFGWVEPIPEEELWAGAQPKRILSYYRLTDLGRRAMGGAS